MQIKVDKITTTKKTITDSDQTILITSDKRRYLLIQNQDENNIVYIDFEKAATVGALAIGPGQNYLVDIEIMESEIHAICDSGLTANIFIVEGEAQFYR